MAVNWGGAGMGALGGAGAGATAGATLGSIFPGVGNVIGGGIGAGLGALTGGMAGLFGGGEEGGMKTAQTMNPEQQKYMSMLLGLGGNALQNPYAGFEPIAKRAMSQFNQNIVPSLAERFTSMGGGRLSSPAFASQLGQAGTGLEEALAAMQSQYGMQNQHNGMSMLALGLSPQFENFYQQSQPGAGENILSGAIKAAPAFYQSYMLNQALQKMQGGGMQGNGMNPGQIVGGYTPYQVQ
jgi:hypothetical protein